MRTLLALPVSRSSTMLAWGLPALFLLMALLALGSGITALVWQQRGELHDVFTGSAATILVLTGLVQATIAWRGARAAWKRQLSRARATTASPGEPWALPVLLRRLFVGLVLCYLMAAATGSPSGAPCVFAAGAMVWLTAALLPLTAHPTTIDSWRRLTQRRGTRRAARVLYLGLLCGVLGEMSLRAGGWLWEALVADEHEPIGVSLADGAETQGATPGRAGSPTTMHLFASPAAAATRAPLALVEEECYERPYKVAVMGDEISLQAANPGGALAQMEAALPGVKLFDLSAPQAGPREYARHQIQQARKVSPNLVLTFVSVGDDIVSEPPREDLFDWRSLSVSRLMRRYLGWPRADKAGASAGLPTAPRDDWEAYVASCGPQLAVCRKPIDAAMQRRWKMTLRYLDELERGCREAGIPLALVIVPSPVQTNRPLLEAACRRQGYSKSDVDLELPQRRLAAYAAERSVPAFDLLPALRLCEEPPFVHQGWRWSHQGNAAVAEALSGWLQTTFTGPYAAAHRSLDHQALDRHALDHRDLDHHGAAAADSLLIARKP